MHLLFLCLSVVVVFLYEQWVVFLHLVSPHFLSPIQVVCLLKVGALTYKNGVYSVGTQRLHVEPNGDGDDHKKLCIKVCVTLYTRWYNPKMNAYGHRVLILLNMYIALLLHEESALGFVWRAKSTWEQRRYELASDDDCHRKLTLSRFSPNFADLLWVMLEWSGWLHFPPNKKLWVSVL